MATPVVMRGVAAVEGVFSSAESTTTGATGIDAIIYSQKQNIDADHQFDQEHILDSHGYFIGWLFRNERIELDCMLKLVDFTTAPTFAHAKAPVNASAPDYNASAFSNFQPLLGPGTNIILSGFYMACLNNTFLIQPGTKLTFRNTQVAEWSIKAVAFGAAQSLAAQTVIPTLSGS